MTHLPASIALAWFDWALLIHLLGILAVYFHLGSSPFDTIVTISNTGKRQRRTLSRLKSSAPVTIQ